MFFFCFGSKNAGLKVIFTGTTEKSDMMVTKTLDFFCVSFSQNRLQIKAVSILMLNFVEKRTSCY